MTLFCFIKKDINTQATSCEHERLSSSVSERLRQVPKGFCFLLTSLTEAVEQTVAALFRFQISVGPDIVGLAKVQFTYC